MKFTDFGFKENPFSITPDPRYLYLSRGHEESLAHLIYGTGPNGGFVLLTGEVGTGKTLLIRSLLAQQLADVDIALILNPRLSRREFLASICDELGIKYEGPPYSLKQLFDSLSRHLLKTHGAGRHTVLVVDEAQNLNPRVLEQVRLLTNLETTRHKLLRIILVGQPELLQILARPELRQVDQRITARYHLSPLNRQETARYITHRLAVAGIREDLFTQAAVGLIHRATRGVPRKINTVCERALLAIFSRGKARAGVALVWRAAREVKGSRRFPGRWGWSLAGLTLLLLAAGIYGYFLPAPLTGMAGGNDGAEEVASPPVSAAEPRGDLAPSVEPAPEHAPSGPDNPGAGAQAESLAAVSPPDPAQQQEGSAPPPVEAPVDGQEAAPSYGLEAFDPSTLFGGPQSMSTLYRSLFDLWGVTYNPDSPLSPCMQAPERKLRCLRNRGDWSRLLEIDRPMILRLKQGKLYRHLLLKLVDGEHLVVDTGQTEALVTRSRLASYWDGEFVLLWRPHGGEAVIGEGSSGEPVTWLRRRLQMADDKVSSPTGNPDRFDDGLKARLKAFQRSHGLEEDGVAGQETLIYLNNLSLPPGTPSLRPAQGQGGG